MRWLARGLSVTVVAALCVACGRDTGKAVNVIGSTSVQPFAEMLAEEFGKTQADVQVEVQGGGSTAGIQAVNTGIAEIGMCSRGLKPEEKGLTAIPIARDGIAVVVNLSNPVSGLSLRQIRDLFAGRIGNWKDVGGKDQPVRLITREEGSGTREAFTHLVMGKVRIAATALTQESNGAVKELVKGDRSAIGYMSLGLVGKELKVLAVDGVAPSVAEVVAGTYPLVRPFLFVVKGTPGEAAQRFVDFVLSPAGQALLEKEGLVRSQ